MTTPHDPFGRSAMPSSCSTREDRVRWLVEAAHILIASGTPAGMFVGAAILAWLESGGGIGALERDFLRITPERGSKLTAAALLRKLQCIEGEPCEETRESSNDDDERIEDTGE